MAILNYFKRWRVVNNGATFQGVLETNCNGDWEFSLGTEFYCTELEAKNAIIDCQIIGIFSDIEIK